MRKHFQHILGAALLGFLALGAISCEEEPVIPDPELILAKPSVSSHKGSQFLWVSATGAWTLASDADWVQIKPAKGVGSSHSVALSYDANDTDGTRAAKIVLNAQEKTVVVTLQQNAPSEDPMPEVNGGSSTQKGWLELPETRVDDGLNFFWHNMNVGKYSGRNYSFYWDYTKLVAHWVAYPMNTGLKGSGSRTDAWGLDPLLPAGKQPIVTSTYRNGWTRGHQIPSADRLQNSANVATFYGTNMTPQNYDFNTGIWARLEDKVRSWSGRCDTLYVVTGCVVDGKTSWTTDVQGKPVAVPNAYYKAVISYSSSSTEKGGYRGCAVYLEHTISPDEVVTRDHPSVMSIRELEQKLGFNLFVNLPAVVGNETAMAIETENPNTVNWWWN